MTEPDVERHVASILEKLGLPPQGDERRRMPAMRLLATRELTGARCLGRAWCCLACLRVSRPPLLFAWRRLREHHAQRAAGPFEDAKSPGPGPFLPGGSALDVGETCPECVERADHEEQVRYAVAVVADGADDTVDRALLDGACEEHDCLLVALVDRDLLRVLDDAGTMFQTAPMRSAPS